MKKGKRREKKDSACARSHFTKNKQNHIFFIHPSPHILLSTYNHTFLYKMKKHHLQKVCLLSLSLSLSLSHTHTLSFFLILLELWFS